MSKNVKLAGKVREMLIAFLRTDEAAKIFSEMEFNEGNLIRFTSDVEVGVREMRDKEFLFTVSNSTSNGYNRYSATFKIAP